LLTEVLEGGKGWRWVGHYWSPWEEAVAGAGRKRRDRKASIRARSPIILWVETPKVGSWKRREVMGNSVQIKRGSWRSTQKNR